MSYEADQAETALRELGTLTERTRFASRSMVTGFPLVGWGSAYIVGLAALNMLDGVLRIAVVALAYLFGVALSWLPTRDVIRTGTDARMRVAWFVVLFGSAFVITASRPESFIYATLAVGALWGLAMCLYAVATEDALFAVVAGFGTVIAGVLGILDVAYPLALFGGGAGLPLLVLGVYRVFHGVRHV